MLFLELYSCFSFISTTVAEQIGPKCFTNGDEYDYFLIFFVIFGDFRNFGRVVERGVAATL